MSVFNVIAVTDESTVVEEYKPDEVRQTTYQTEAELEKELIERLQSQGYTYVSITDEKSLIDNLRAQLSKLNKYNFSDSEWGHFFNNCVANPNDQIKDKTKRIQDDYIQNLKRDDGSTKNIKLIDKENVHNNSLQVINQYTETGERYDVTILVNGLPLVHIELKRRGVDIREAFNQIKRYARNSFGVSSRLFEYVQIFVISNGTQTRYYSNTTRESQLDTNRVSKQKKDKKTSNTFEFTSYWADSSNHAIMDLTGFTKTFFAKNTLLAILTRYCVLTVDSVLMVMRPYQIVATEKILSRINIAFNNKKQGTIEAGGYVFHTTGSGKTLTSFKVAQLASTLPYIDKVVFVVDRKDLDYQTMKEYDKFEQGAVSGSKSTRELAQNLKDPTVHIVVTTIQKLDRLISKNAGHTIFDKQIVMVFDECHRSQFGGMHQKIIKAFKNYYLFGFTGTPIFGVNSSSGGNPLCKTTGQVFGDKLHSYTIVNAIHDQNVLPFLIDYVDTFKVKDGIKDKNVLAIDREKVLSDSVRIRGIVSYILEHFDQKTKRNKVYTLEGKRIDGFNSLLAVNSIPVAKKYYLEFKEQLAESEKDLVVATIFSCSVNELDADDMILDEAFETEGLDVSSRDFLDSVIVDYNQTFGTNFDSSTESFQGYYKDLTERVRNKEVDLLIVVNMFLTGFDAKTLNTLWVDKNLKQHGLIQAFSRTNRILNSVKTFGNIVCFRNLKKETDAAIALFGDDEAENIVLLKGFDDYYNGFDEGGVRQVGYVKMVDDLVTRYPIGTDLVGEKTKKDFIKLYGAILKMRNILTAFDAFNGKGILSDRDLQDYQSLYIDLYSEFSKSAKLDQEQVNLDIAFEMELVRQDEINIDYILKLVGEYHASNCKDKDILVSIRKTIDASIQLRSKKDLIEKFVGKVNITNVDDDWKTFVREQKDAELHDLIVLEALKSDETKRFMNDALRDRSLKTIGTDIDLLLQPTSRFYENDRGVKKSRVTEKLLDFFEKYNGIV